VETRVIGADANPYLLIGAILAAGLLGIEEALEPTQASEEDCWEVTSNLPDNLDLALLNLASSEKMADLLGREFLDVFASIKRSELQDFNIRISSWEISYLGSML
jgi:glutamine synthetase